MHHGLKKVHLSGMQANQYGTLPYQSVGEGGASWTRKMVLPYTIDISDERLATIRAKVEGYDWSQLPDAGGWTVGGWGQ